MLSIKLSILHLRLPAQLFLVLLIAVFSAHDANATLVGFSDDFTGPTLDAAWSTSGDAANHLGLSAGTYGMTHANGTGAPKLSRSNSGTLTSYTHEVEVVMDTFRLSANPGTGADLKWKMFGADGFMEVVLNSFGNARLFHNNTVAGAGGNLATNVPFTGLADGDTLSLSASYDQVTDEIDVSYSINGGTAATVYSGAGSGGSIGDVITNFVEVEVFQFNGGAADDPVVAIDSWNLTAIPEPSSAALLGLLSLSLMSLRRR